MHQTCNHHHRDSGTGLMTSAAVHYGHAGVITTAQGRILNEAFALHPQRLKGKPPLPPTVHDTVYINPSLTKDTAAQKTH